MAPVTLKDIARICNVHPSTVSRVLREQEPLKISKNTRDKILETARELKYQPDQTARALRTKKSYTVGLIIPNISSPYFSGIAKVIDQRCGETGYTLIISDSNENQDKEIRIVNDLVSRGVDGIIIAPVQESDKHIRELVEKKYPLVVIDRCFKRFKTNSVISNDEEIAYKTVKYLANHGHRSIGFITGRPNLYPVTKRLIGYEKALNDLGLPLKKEFILKGTQSIESGYQSFKTLLSLPDFPTAILISGTIITLGSIKAIMDNGYKIPDDISIIGFTDIPYAEYLSIPLTTVSHKINEIGKEAYKLLLHEMISGSIVSDEIVVESVMNVRKSVAQMVDKPSLTTMLNA